MSCRLLVMLVFILIRWKSQSMIESTILNQIEDCFYEKRRDTSLSGYNDLHDRWISELDCLDRCLKLQPQACRSFEHWHSNRHGLCVLANLTLTDQPSSMNINLFVNYYEIHCEKDTKAVRLQSITCPGEQLQALVTLNGIDRNYILLGDSSCKPLWSNETHAQFVTHVDNCSLILTDGSIVGKLRWEGVDKDTNEARQYERFFLCPSDIYQIRSPDWSSTTHRPMNLLTSSRHSSTTTHRRLSSQIYDDQRTGSTIYRLSLQWILHNRTYSCPQICTLSLYSFIHVKFNEFSSISSSNIFIDSCDFVALHPYSNYFQTRRLIHQGCSTDPAIIHFSSEIPSQSTFDCSFYLYNIVKEPIPFEIHCQIHHHHHHHLTDVSFVNNCSSMTSIDHEQLIRSSNEKKDFNSMHFRSSPIIVARQIPSNLLEENPLPDSNSFASIITVHQIKCFFIAFSLFIHWIVS